MGDSKCLQMDEVLGGQKNMFHLSSCTVLTFAPTQTLLTNIHNSTKLTSVGNIFCHNPFHSSQPKVAAQAVCFLRSLRVSNKLPSKTKRSWHRLAIRLVLSIERTDTVDGRYPAPVDMVNIPLFTGFRTSQVVVWDF